MVGPDLALGKQIAATRRTTDGLHAPEAFDRRRDEASSGSSPGGGYGSTTSWLRLQGATVRDGQDRIRLQCRWSLFACDATGQWHTRMGASQRFQLQQENRPFAQKGWHPRRDHRGKAAVLAFDFASGKPGSRCAISAVDFAGGGFPPITARARVCSLGSSISACAQPNPEMPGANGCSASIRRRPAAEQAGRTEAGGGQAEVERGECALWVSERASLKDVSIADVNASISSSKIPRSAISAVVKRQGLCATPPSASRTPLRVLRRGRRD
jgi:hypothetical protein